ncbi:MAG: hypothetical protein OJF49_003566 [Ktedonobacterales bacterium]|jgi:hypothetical protein|nr:MAG: hypothetical protein OJF49_003566 [Ktedonobacterales bacterium]
MAAHETALPTPVGAQTTLETEPHLRGKVLLLARLGWVTLVTLYLGLYVAMLPTYAQILRTTCAGDTCSPEAGQLTAQQAHALLGAGITTSHYAAMMVGISVFGTLIACAVGVLVFWRKSGDRIGLLVSLLLMVFGVENLNALVRSVPGQWQFIANIMSGFFFFLLYLTVLTFPDGRFVPRWTRWLALVTLVAMFLSIMVSSSLAEEIISYAWYFTIYVSMLFVQVYRYRAVSTFTQRQQTKWVVFALCIVILVNLVRWFILPFIPIFNDPNSSAIVFQAALWPLVTTLIPLSFGIAILRYKLYNIDILINRALVYSSLTAILALVYVGSVIGLQRIVSRVLIGQGASTLAIVVSTLLIAALFQPLRRRIQQTIDRRFYRAKYDAVRTLEAFSETLRHEVDLTELSEHLVAAVHETMRPAHVSLWLAKLEQTSAQRPE